MTDFVVTEVVAAIAVWLFGAGLALGLGPKVIGGDAGGAIFACLLLWPFLLGLIFARRIIKKTADHGGESGLRKTDV